jgi:glucokinase
MSQESPAASGNEEAPHQRQVIGVDIGGSSIKLGLIGMDGRYESIPPIPTPRGRDAVDCIIARITDAGLSLVNRAGAHPEAVGLVIPGVIDQRRGVAVTATNMPWNNDPLAERVEDALKLRTFLGHDVRAAAVGEAMWGAGRNVDEFLLIALGTGVGAAAYRRRASADEDRVLVGEFGHTSVALYEPRCRCGRDGCVEALASGRALAERYRKRTGYKGKLNGRVVQKRMEAEDPDAMAVWCEAARALAAAILNCLVLVEFSPQLILLAGGLADAGDLLLKPVLAAIKAKYPRFLSKEQLYEQKRKALVQISSYGRLSGLAGAGALAWIRLNVSREELWCAGSCQPQSESIGGAGRRGPRCV